MMCANPGVGTLLPAREDYPDGCRVCLRLSRVHLTATGRSSIACEPARKPRGRGSHETDHSPPRRRRRVRRVVVSAGRAGVRSGGFAGGHLETESRQIEVQPRVRRRRAPRPNIKAAGQGVKVVVGQAQADGTVRHWEFTANYDGKDSKVTGNNPDADTVARTRVDANTVQTVSKKSGKVTTTQTSEVSADGKTRTVTTKGVNARRPASEQRRGLRQAVA